jgi:hypothetical protein
MDNVDRIVPITPLGAAPLLKVSDTNKDGGQRNTPEEHPHESPHDVLELHDQEIVLELSEEDESDESPTIGLDLAV